MKKIIWSIIKFIGLGFLSLGFGVLLYVGFNHLDKNKFKNLKHGETMYTTSGDVYYNIKSATDSIVLWDKKYKINKHIIKEDENVIAYLYGADTIIIYAQYIVGEIDHWGIDITKK
jgi:hypothetical protein